MASQLLTFGKGGAPIVRSSSVAQLLAASVDLARAGSQVRFDLAVPDDLWPADIDVGQISQAFHNVLLNARQAVPEGGVVDVRAKNVVIDEAVQFISAGKYVRILLSPALTNIRIAQHLFIREQTVKNHLHTIFEKLHVESRQQAVLRLASKNLLSAPG